MRVKEWTKQSGPCSFEVCDNSAATTGLCKAHYAQKRRGQELRELRPKRGYGKGYTDSKGYKWVWAHDHKNAYADGRILEHVFVMSEVLGRPLLPGENVHHKNGVRDDNRPENLELWVVTQPFGQRPEDLVAWAKEILARYDN